MGIFATLVATSAAPGAFAQSPLGPDLQLNESGIGQQLFPHVTMSREGDFVTAWDEDIAGPIFGEGTRAIVIRRYAGTGLPVGGNLPVVGPEDRFLADSNIALAPNGNLLVLWTELDGADQRAEIRASIFDPAGQPVVEGLRINTHEPGDQQAPGVAADSSSNFIVTWWSIPLLDSPGQDGSGSGVFARRLSATGEFLGPEFQVNTYTEGPQFPGSVATAPDGSFVIVWSSVGQDGSDGGIYSQRFSADGARAGTEFRVNQYTDSWQEYPDVAMDPAGNFVVVWESFEQDGSVEGVYARRFDAAGLPLGDEFQVNTNTFSYQELPRVAMDSAGNFVVVWVDWFTGPRLPDIVGRAFHADGAPAGGEFRVNAHDRNDQDFPDIVLSDTGTAVAVWQSHEQDGDQWGVFGRRVAVPFPSECVPSEVALCLGAGRFRVEADWELFEVAAGVGRAVPLTADSGAFSFFGPDNLELLVKLLPGCGVNDRFWLFAGGLTNVGVRLNVIDTATGTIRVYQNPEGRAFQPVLDAAAFDTCDAVFAPRAGELETPRPAAAARPSAASGACQADAETLCLRGGRFEVRAHWRAPQGTSGPARAVPLTAETGAFWFFGANNPEILVKALDGCPVNGAYWIFAGGLTNVEVDLTVRDTVAGTVQTYQNPAATPFQPIQDTTSFETCGASPAGTGD